MSSPTQNIAKLSGYASEPAAAVFSALYMLLAVWFLVQSFRFPTFVHFALVVFCSRACLLYSWFCVYIKLMEYICIFTTGKIHSSYSSIHYPSDSHKERFVRSKAFIIHCRSVSFRDWILWATLLCVHSCPRSVSRTLILSPVEFVSLIIRININAANHSFPAHHPTDHFSVSPRTACSSD